VSVHVLLLALALVALPVTTAAAQTPRDRARPVPQKAGRIAGIVMSAERDPKPVRRARVTLNGAALQTGRTAITGDDGGFVFDALPAGQYNVAAAKTGYIAVAYGASGPGRAGMPVTVTAGAQHTLTIPLPRAAAITGMLTDTEGQPLPGLQVRALTYRITAPFGERQLVEAGHPPVVTDDRGVYRIFGLPAGNYIVAARPRPGLRGYASGLRTVSPAELRQALAEVRQPRNRRPAASAASTRSIPPEPGGSFAMASVFFPGTTAAAQARLVSLTAGEERTGTDFQIDYVPVARVAGSVVASTAGSTRAYVRLIPETDAALVDEHAYRGVTTEPNGAFAFEHVPPGRYVIAARASADGSMPLRYDPASALWASTEVVVDGREIPDIVLVPAPGLTLEGRIMFQGQRSPPRLADFHSIGLPLRSRLSPGGNAVVVVGADGRFTIPSVPAGRYLLEFTPGIRAPIGAWWLKSIAIGGQEALDSPLDLRESIADVTVTFADTASELSGRVVDSSGDPASYCTVVVFPADRRSWFFNSRRIAAVRPDPQGRYSVRNLPAGDYLIVARTDLDPLEWFDPDVLEKLAGAAAAVTIETDASSTHDIKVMSGTPR